MENILRKDVETFSFHLRSEKIRTEMMQAFASSRAGFFFPGSLLIPRALYLIGPCAAPAASRVAGAVWCGSHFA